jgi:hemerythrin-like domain-containing protein
MDSSRRERRGFLVLAAGTLAAAHAHADAGKDKDKDKDVGANEDLMREHGVLRRALLVYRAAAARLRTDPGKVPADALAQTAHLFRTFGEDYHERKLEEDHIFPAVRKAKGPAARLVDVLLAQHERGRQLTDYVLRTTAQGRIAAGAAAPLAQALDAFELMYEHHTAREDTIVFPAWKEALSGKAYEEMSERFEDIEKRMFGHDGFEDAVRRIAAIEARFGIDDLARFTMPAPPTA